MKNLTRITAVLAAFAMVFTLAYAKPADVYAEQGVFDEEASLTAIDQELEAYSKGAESAEDVLWNIKQAIAYDGLLDKLREACTEAEKTVAPFREAVVSFDDALNEIINAMIEAEAAAEESVHLSSAGGRVSLSASTETFTLEDYRNYEYELRYAQEALEEGVSGEALWEIVKRGLPMAGDEMAAVLTETYKDYAAAKAEVIQALEDLPASVRATAAVTGDGLYDKPVIVKDDNMTSGQKVTYDCIWFGSYPQVEIVDDPLTSGVFRYWEKHVSYKVNKRIYKLLQNADGWDENGDITIEGVKYRRVRQSDTYNKDTNDTFDWYNTRREYHYFRYMPIKWRILEHVVQFPHDKLLLSADMLLDDQPYNLAGGGVTWGTSTVRSWLNGLGAKENADGVDFTGKNFINSAFTAEEQNLIYKTMLDFSDTKEKVFLLGDDDVHGFYYPSYGFTQMLSFDEAGYRRGTSYARVMGVYCANSEDTGTWWLRTPMYKTYRFDAMLSSGHLSYQEWDSNSDAGICPALYFTGLSSELFKPAGTYCTDGTVKETNSPVVQETQSWTVTAKTKSVKYKNVRKKALTVAPLTVKNKVGTLSYKVTGGTAKSKKALKLNTKTGRVTVKKGTKKGTYKIKVRVTASGSKYFEKATAAKTVTVKVK